MPGVSAADVAPPAATPDDDDAAPRPRFTARHLRADVTLDACALRLVREVLQRRDTKRNFGARAAFALSARLVGDIVTAHSELVTPTPAAFPTPTDLGLEEQRVYRAAAIGYRSVFPEPFVIDPLPDEWETADPETGHRWVAPVPIAGRDEDERSRVRVVGIGRGAGAIDEVGLHLLALRTEGWADEVLVDPASLLDADRGPALRIDPSTRAAARAWAAPRVDAILALGSDPKPRMGRDCLGCPFVASCPVHR